MIIKKILGTVIVVYVLIFAGVFLFQRSLLYFPKYAYVPLSEAHANRSLQEISVRTADGLDLKAWYAPATTKTYTIVFFHGNGDNLSSAAPVADPYIDAGYGFLLAEYRGYSWLPGKPSESGLYADARADLYALMALGVKSEQIILFGQSLGTGVATEMAEEFHVGGLMLLAPYRSITQMAQIDFPIFPAKWIVLDRFENDKKIGKIHTPVLIVNGAKDRVVPPLQGRQLYWLANEPRKYVLLPDCGHNDAFDEFAVVSLAWIERLR